MKTSKVKGFTIITVDGEGVEGSEYEVSYDGQHIWLKDVSSDSTLIEPEAWGSIQEAVERLLSDDKRPKVGQS